jgi:hypothetical protein
MSKLEKYYPPSFLWEFFSEEVNQMKASFFVKQWMQESIKEGLERGLEQGLEQGKQTQQRTDILDILAQRFNPPATRYLPIVKQLESITDSDCLHDLLLYAALHATDIGDFEQRLAGV